MERPTEVIHVVPPESPALTRPHGREYHVNVGTEDGEAGPSSFDRDLAITLAIRAAQHDYADGTDVSVCVEEQDGTFKLAWASA